MLPEEVCSQYAQSCNGI